MSRRDTGARLALALALTLAACGDDDVVERFRVQRDAALVNALGPGAADVVGGDAGQDVAPPPDVVSPQDTGAPDAPPPKDATPPEDTGSPDVVTPVDTAGPAPLLTGDDVLPIPWVAAGAGGSQGTLTLTNTGGAGPVSVQLTGAAELSLVSAPTSVGAGGTLAITVAFSGSAVPVTVGGQLTVTAGGQAHATDVWAVAGDPAIPAGTWQPLTGPEGVRYGDGVILPFPTAPYPQPGGSWTDPSVALFVPDGLRDRGATDVVVHFHGFGATVPATLGLGDYREQLYLSGANAVLVVPQGPVDASSGDFGKLMDAGNLELLLTDVVRVLYRDDWIRHPVVGEITLTAHSGGYQAVAQNLDAAVPGGDVHLAALFDGLYAREADFVAFVGPGHRFRSNYTTSGGTLSDNEDVLDTLGASADDRATFGALRDAPAVIWFTESSHNKAMTGGNAYTEVLRWGSRHGRGGPRVAIRTARRSGGSALVTWLAPADDDVTTYVVETSPDGLVWTVGATAAASATSATAPIPSSGAWVRVASRAEGVDVADALASDAVFVGGPADVLVVDGFDRRLGSSFAGIRHDFAARVGAAAGAATAASNEAVREGEIDLSAASTVVWLLGDESTEDATFDDTERSLISAHLAGGGRVIASGSEIAWDLRNRDAAFLRALGATYRADDAGTTSATGVGPLSGVGAISFGGPQAPYVEDFPDELNPVTGALELLEYATGDAAAVGIAGQSAVVGFPLELVAGDAALASLLAGLLDFVGGD